MADILDKYNSQSSRLAYYPEQGMSTPKGRDNRFQVNPQLFDSKLTSTFDKTNLDLENPNPLGGKLNIPYTSKIGTEIVSSPTSHPYTPNRTYKDSLQDPLLIARAIDPYK